MRNSLVSMRAVLAALGLALAVTGLAAAQQAPQALNGKTAEQYLIRIAGLSPAQGLTVHVEKVQDNVPIDNSKFDKPAPKAP